jgi:hypothetical protein
LDLDEPLRIAPRFRERTREQRDHHDREHVEHDEQQLDVAIAIEVALDALGQLVRRRPCDGRTTAPSGSVVARSVSGPSTSGIA